MFLVLWVRGLCFSENFAFLMKCEDHDTPLRVPSVIPLRILLYGRPYMSFSVFQILVHDDVYFCDTDSRLTLSSSALVCRPSRSVSFWRYSPPPSLWRPVPSLPLWELHPHPCNLRLHPHPHPTLGLNVTSFCSELNSASDGIIINRS
jgi:hypothetical protein